MSLRRLCNAAYAALCEGLDDDGCRRMDRALLGELLPQETPAEAFVRGRSAQPRRGAPVDFRVAQKDVQAPQRGSAAPPPIPAGYQLAPVGVQVRQPEPTRGLDVLDAALGVAPKPVRKRPSPAVRRG